MKDLCLKNSLRNRLLFLVLIIFPIGVNLPIKMTEVSTNPQILVEDNFTQLEGYLMANVNIDYFGNVKMKKNWFYYANDSLYIKMNKEDIWFTHCLPKSCIYSVKVAQSDQFSFEVNTLYMNLFCTASEESEFLKWTQNLQKIIDNKGKGISSEDFLNDFYNNKNNVNNFCSSLVKDILSQCGKWKVSKGIMVESLMNELYKVEASESELFIDKPLQGKKQVIVAEKDLEKYRVKAEKVEKLEAENLELTKKISKLSIGAELKSLAEEELENYKLVNIKLQNFIKQKEMKIGEYASNELKLKQEMQLSEQRLEEAKKIEEKVKLEKLDFLSIQTKNQQMEAFVKIQEGQIEKLKKDLEDKKRDSIELTGLNKTLQKFKDREKQLVTLIQNYEEKLKTGNSKRLSTEELKELDVLVGSPETEKLEKPDRLSAVQMSPRVSDGVSPKPSLYSVKFLN